MESHKIPWFQTTNQLHIFSDFAEFSVFVYHRFDASHSAASQLAQHPSFPRSHCKGCKGSLLEG